MNSVELVKAICKERRIPISRLERECGFSNGYISQLRKGDFPAERLMTISNYLDVDYEYLLNGKKIEVTRTNPDDLSKTEYGKLTSSHKAVVDSLIHQLLASQSDE